MPTAEHGFPRLFTVGSIQTRDPSELRSLVNSKNQITADRFDSLQRPRGTDYQVPTGKTLYITRVRGHALAAAGTGTWVRIGYGNDAVADSAVSPTSPLVVAEWGFLTGQDRDISWDTWIPIPAGKYPFAQSTGGVWNIAVEGIEV